MKRILLVLSALLFLATPSVADRDRINGSWISSSGAYIVVGPPDNGGEFVMNVYESPTSNVLTNQIRAGWFDGPNFAYKVNGKQFTGLYKEKVDQVEVQNRSGSWKSTWRRD